MKISKKYSHLNGEEFLIVHHNDIYNEIKKVIGQIDADKHRSKISNEKTKRGAILYSPVDINKEFKSQLGQMNWKDTRYNYYLTMNRQLMEATIHLSAEKQKEYLIQHGEENPIFSYNQTDFVKDGIAIEVQFGKYAFVAYDLFVKHMLFFTGGVIDLGIEILPTKAMQSQMSSGIAYFEGEIYNIMRQGRSSPPVPLLIMGIEP